MSALPITFAMHIEPVVDFVALDTDLA